MNTSSNTVNCYEVSENGVRAVSVPLRIAQESYDYWSSLVAARAKFKRKYRTPKPRIAPRMGVASPSVAAA